MISGDLMFNDNDQKPWSHSSLLTKVKTAKSFLRYLPQIIVLVNQGDKNDPPWDDIDYSYLGKFPNSKLVQFDGGDVPKHYIE